MSIVYEKFPYTDDKDKRSKIVEAVRKKLGKPDAVVSFYDEEIFLEREKAENALQSAVTPHAVHYIEWNEAQARPKKFDEYRRRAQELQDKAKAVKETPHYVGVKQRTLGCKSCKKRIDIVDMALSNDCPYCGASQLPMTKCKQIDKYNADAKALLERADAEELAWVKGKCEKGKHRWLIAYDI